MPAQLRVTRAKVNIDRLVFLCSNKIYCTNTFSPAVNRRGTSILTAVRIPSPLTVHYCRFIHEIADRKTVSLQSDETRGALWPPAVLPGWMDIQYVSAAAFPLMTPLLRAHRHFTDNENSLTSIYFFKKM